MSKYLKLFETTSQYNEYINGSDVVLPNVSVAKDAPKIVYFNPIPPPMNIITYEATAKLTETTTSWSSGLHTNAFSGKSGQLTITSHTFENRIGTIEFDGDVTGIGDSAFYRCTGLTSITIPDSVTSIGREAFRECSGLTSATIGNGVISIGDSAFSNCTGLTSITIPNSVTSIGNSSFFYCTGLTSITIPNSVTSIGNSAFLSCSGLTSITIPDSVTSIGDMAFTSCSGLTSIVVDSANTVYNSRDNCNALINTSTNELITGCKNTVIPNTVTSIGSQAFNSCTGLTSITIPDSVTSIGSGAFFNCSDITSVTIGSGVTSIGKEAFNSCTGLTSITSLATTAPTIQSNTFRSVKTGGTLYVPSGTDYDVWMGTGNYYLGKYNWTKVEQ